METNIRRERPLFNCSEVVNNEPCRYYVLKEGKKVIIEVDPNDYREIGRNEDAIFLVKKVL